MIDLVAIANYLTASGAFSSYSIFVEELPDTGGKRMAILSSGGQERKKPLGATGETQHYDDFQIILYAPTTADAITDSNLLIDTLDGAKFSNFVYIIAKSSPLRLGRNAEREFGFSINFRTQISI